MRQIHSADKGHEENPKVIRITFCVSRFETQIESAVTPIGEKENSLQVNGYEWK